MTYFDLIDYVSGSPLIITFYAVLGLLLLGVSAMVERLWR